MAQAFLNPSWIGWIRDIVPQDVMGSFFSQRMRIATIAAAVAGLVGAFYIDWWAGRVPEPEQIYGYSYAMLFGSILLGFGAVGFMARMPEPRMVAPEGQRPTILQMLAAPLRDANYRQLMSFLMVWSLASQLAVPFFLRLHAHQARDAACRPSSDLPCSARRPACSSSTSGAATSIGLAARSFCQSARRSISS